MKTINALILAVVILLTSCQKEITKNSPTNIGKGITASSSIPGVQMKKDGYPYPNIQTTSSFGDDEIGWHIDVHAVESGYTKSAPQQGPVSSLGPAYLYCGGIHTVQLLAGQNIPMGTLTYANDAQNFYVTYTTDPDWFMSEVHLYVGPLALMPKAGGNPPPGKFPISTTFTASTLSQTVSYTIPLTSLLLSGGFAVAAHASVLQVDTDGDVVGKETAWASGPKVPGAKNWSMYVPVYLDYCGGGPADLAGHSSSN
jgi:hypothetical protein